MSIGAALDATQREYIDQGPRHPRSERPERPALLRGGRLGAARARDARVDRPAARHDDRQRIRERPRPRGERRRPYLPRQLARGWGVGPGGQADFRNNLENVVLPANTAGGCRSRSWRSRSAATASRATGSRSTRTSPWWSRTAWSSLVAGAGGRRGHHRRHGGRPERRRLPRAGRVFALHQRVRNTGTDVATGVSATLAGNGVADLTQATRPTRHHGRLRAGERHPLRGQLGGAARAGWTPRACST